MPPLVEPTQRHERTASSALLPRRWSWLIRRFQRYAHRYVSKHFHAVRLSATSSAFPPAGFEPLLIVLNHPSWWDPMMGTVLSTFMPEREHFAAIDAEAVKRYAFFRWLGFVGVDTKSLRGAAEFLKLGTTILSAPNRVYWVTAQGRFADVRERPLALQSGAGHLAARLDRGIVLPLALEYAFWSERTPEALIRIGDPLRVEDHRGRSGKEWLSLIEEALTRNLDQLNAETLTRDPSKFRDLVVGRAGVGGPYDLWRRFRALLKRERFDPAHASVMRGKQP